MKHVLSTLGLVLALVSGSMAPFAQTYAFIFNFNSPDSFSSPNAPNSGEYTYKYRAVLLNNSNQSICVKTPSGTTYTIAPGYSYKTMPVSYGGQRYGSGEQYDQQEYAVYPNADCSGSAQGHMLFGMKWHPPSAKLAHCPHDPSLFTREITGCTGYTSPMNSSYYSPIHSGAGIVNHNPKYYIDGYGDYVFEFFVAN